MITTTDTDITFPQHKWELTSDISSEISPELQTLSYPDLDPNTATVDKISHNELVPKFTSEIADKTSTLKDLVTQILITPSKKITKNQRKNISSATFRSEAKSVNMKSKAWNTEEDKLFLKLLGVYGTDFTTIAQSMMSKNRTQVKNKFKRLDDTDSDLINRALKGEFI